MSLSKHWTFTSFDVEREPFSSARDRIDYLVCGRERCGATGRPHWQGYVAFKGRTRLSAIKKLEPGVHAERRLGSAREAADYCRKGGDFIEFGDHPPPERADNLGARAALRLARAGLTERLADEHPGLWLRYKRNLESMREFRCAELADSCGVWVSGPPRCGKDYGVRSFAGASAVFEKSLTKWWDGYDDQPVVLVSDVEPQHGRWVGYYLKIWMDRYPFRAEVKGGTVLIRPSLVVVTSNFELEQVLGGEESVLTSAVRARCARVSVDEDGRTTFCARPSFRTRAGVANCLRANVMTPWNAPSTSHGDSFEQ